MTDPPSWSRRGRRRRPPWWPEGEPWPPTGPPPWTRGRGWRRPRALAFLVIAVVLAIALVNLFLGLLGYLILPTTAAGKLLAAAFGIVVLALLVANARQLARDTRRVREAARRVEEGDYSARVEEGGFGAIASLSRAFNAMSSKLEAREARRRTFLAEVTHELRTPLAIIRGEAEAIADGVHSADAENLGRILEATAVVERLVGDLGVLSAGEPGDLRLRKEDTELALLVADVLGSLQGAAETAEVSLEEAVPAGLSAHLDPVRVRGVLVNLLTNSIRHTPAGGSVRVSARLAGEEVEVTVSDTGSGIEPELLPRVLDRFVKGPDSPGSGLGLAIAREVVEAHGGRIEVESRPGEGTIVRAWLPA